MTFENPAAVVAWMMSNEVTELHRKLMGAAPTTKVVYDSHEQLSCTM